MKADLNSSHLDAGNNLLREFAENQRRLAFLKRAQLFNASMQGAEIRRAVEADDLRQAFRIVHDAFVQVGYVKPSPDGMRIRPFEAAGETANFIAKKDSEVVGVLGLIVDSPDLGLPSDNSFRPELDALRAKGMKVSEGTNQAVVPSFRKTGVTMELVRCGIAHSVERGCDAIVVTVSPSHARFYEVLGFRRIGDVRSYSATIYDPVVMMCIDTPAGGEEAESDPWRIYTRKFLFTENPYRRNIHEWHKAAERGFRDPDLLQGLFISSSDALSSFTPSERKAIRLRWGGELFDRIVTEQFAAEVAAEGTYISMRPSPTPAERHAMT